MDYVIHYFIPATPAIAFVELWVFGMETKIFVLCKEEEEEEEDEDDKANKLFLLGNIWKNNKSGRNWVFL